MRYHGRINYVKCREWGLSMAQGALFDLLNESSSWAKTHIIGDEVYYWVSRNKASENVCGMAGITGAAADCSNSCQRLIT